MTAFILSLGAGIVVGILYALSGVKSPAPPIVALVGLLGMVIGESGTSMVKKRLALSARAEAGSDGPPPPPSARGRIDQGTAAGRHGPPR